MNGSSWAAASDQTWYTLSANSSTFASSQTTVTTTANPNIGVRSAKLTFVMDTKTVKYVYVSQTGRKTLYPDCKRCASNFSAFLFDLKNKKSPKRNPLRADFLIYNRFMRNKLFMRILFLILLTKPNTSDLTL